MVAISRPLHGVVSKNVDAVRSRLKKKKRSLYGSAYFRKNGNLHGLPTRARKGTSGLAEMSCQTGGWLII